MSNNTQPKAQIECITIVDTPPINQPKAQIECITIVDTPPIKQPPSKPKGKKKRGGGKMSTKPSASVKFSMDDSLDESTIHTQGSLDVSMDGGMSMDEDGGVFIVGMAGVAVGGGGDSMMDISTARSKALSKAKSSSRSVSASLITGEGPFPYPPETMKLIMEWRVDNMELGPGKTRLPMMPKAMGTLYKKMAKKETLEMATKSGNPNLLAKVMGWTSKQWEPYAISFRIHCVNSRRLHCCFYSNDLLLISLAKLISPNKV